MKQAAREMTFDVAIERLCFAGIVSMRRDGFSIHERATGYSGCSSKILTTSRTRLTIASGSKFSLRLLLACRVSPMSFRSRKGAVPSFRSTADVPCRSIGAHGLDDRGIAVPKPWDDTEPGFGSRAERLDELEVLKGYASGNL